jgi:hypothetical protein
MIRRPLTATVATLCAALALTACNGSPEAGRPNPTPTSTSPSPTPTAPSTSTRTPEEQAAINAAKAQYLAARAAAAKALGDPKKANRAALERAGNGGAWLADVIEEVAFYRARGWYQAGSVKLSAPTVRAVRLEVQQPEVTLATCLDAAAVVLRYQSNNKAVPVGADNGARHQAVARLILAPGSSGQKTWFLVEEKEAGKC